jgi:hypothetical protein
MRLCASWTPANYVSPYAACFFTILLTDVVILFVIAYAATYFASFREFVTCLRGKLNFLVIVDNIFFAFELLLKTFLSYLLFTDNILCNHTFAVIYSTMVIKKLTKEEELLLQVCHIFAVVSFHFVPYRISHAMCRQNHRPCSMATHW